MNNACISKMKYFHLHVYSYVSFPRMYGILGFTMDLPIWSICFFHVPWCALFHPSNFVHLHDVLGNQQSTPHLFQLTNTGKKFICTKCTHYNMCVKVFLAFYGSHQSNSSKYCSLPWYVAIQSLAWTFISSTTKPTILSMH
jgi:hypothetical protein